MTPAAPSRSQAWLCVALLWFVAFLNYFDRTMLTTMRESLVHAIPMTDAQFGLLTSIFLWIYSVLSPVAGFLADRYNRRNIIIGSLFVWSALTWLTGHARTYNELMFCRALMGISEAFYIPAALALIVDYHRDNTRSLAIGIHMAGIMVGSGLGGLGGWLAEKIDWSYAFTLFGLIGIGYSFVLIAALRETPREETQDKAANPLEKASFIPALKSLFSRWSFFLALLFWGMLAVAGWSAIGWMPTHFKERFNLPQGAAGLYATLSTQIAAMVGVIIGGVFADWANTKWARGRVMVVVIGLLLAAPGILLAANTHTLAFAIIGLSLYGFTRSFADTNMMPILCMVADARYRATGYGILNLFSCMVGGLAVYAGGVLRDGQLDVNKTFQFAAVCLASCAIILFLVKPVAKSTEKKVASEEPAAAKSNA